MRARIWKTRITARDLDEIDDDKDLEDKDNDEDLDDKDNDKDLEDKDNGEDLEEPRTHRNAIVHQWLFIIFRSCCDLTESLEELQDLAYSVSMLSLDPPSFEVLDSPNCLRGMGW